MKLRYKIVIGFLGVVAVGLLALGMALAYTAECPPPGSPPGGVPTMKAVKLRCYGSPEVLRLEDVELPKIEGNQVLVSVHAAGVNPYDWHMMRGEPYLVRLVGGMNAPGDTSFGVDYAGTVEAVGPDVTSFKPGDEVFGGTGGAFAEYVTVRADRGIVHKPANVSFEEAGSVYIAAVTALQGLRDKGQVQPGDRVLINGASGGVGSFAVQIAKAMGAEVTGVCSTRNVEMVRAIGADHVFDYKNEDFTQSGRRWDVILDMVGNHSLGALRDALEPDGTLVMIGSSDMGNFMGPLWRPLWASVLDTFVDQNLETLLARMSQDDLKILADLMQSGAVKPVIDRRFDLENVGEAIEYSESGRARGKIVINVK